MALAQVEEVEWARESWAATCTRSVARIYFLPDEEFWVEVAPNSLITMLTLWLQFLKSGPARENGKGNSVTIPLGEADSLLLQSNVT